MIPLVHSDLGVEREGSSADATRGSPPSLPRRCALAPLLTHLHLFVVTDRLEGQPSPNRGACAAGLQLDNGLGPVGQPSQVTLVLCEMVFLLLKWGGGRQEAAPLSEGEGRLLGQGEGASPTLTRESCSRSSKRVTVMDRSQVNFFFIVS